MTGSAPTSSSISGPDPLRRVVARRTFLVGAVGGGVALMAACSAGSGSPAVSSTSAAAPAIPSKDAAATTAAVVGAATSFLATLTDDQRAGISFPFPTGETKATPAGFSGRVGEKFGDSVWSNYPISDVIRPGLKMGDLTEPHALRADPRLPGVLRTRHRTPDELRAVAQIPT